MDDKAILVDGVVTPIDDTIKWAFWFNNGDNRRVALTEIGNVTVSTVFLGLDHGFGGVPKWFETMVFGGVLDEETERYATLEEAMTGHERMVARVEAQEAQS